MILLMFFLISGGFFVGIFDGFISGVRLASQHHESKVRKKLSRKTVS